MSAYLIRMAETAPTLPNVQAVVEKAIETREAAFGWVNSRLIHAYPGGRTIDQTDVVVRARKRMEDA